MEQLRNSWGQWGRVPTDAFRREIFEESEEEKKRKMEKKRRKIINEEGGKFKMEGGKSMKMRRGPFI